jgi:hypothetical protein
MIPRAGMAAETATAAATPAPAETQATAEVGPTAEVEIREAEEATRESAAVAGIPVR